jgi:hypothetical protein
MIPMFRNLFRRKIVKVLTEQAKKKPENATYLVSSLFLHENYDLMKNDTIETFYYVTGPEIDGIRILDRIEKFGYEERNGAFAKAVTLDSTRKLIKLDEHDHRLWGYFHSHLEPGVSGTNPSFIDLRFRDLLDRGGHKAIGVIFSRDSFIRFFSAKPFRVIIYGKGVEKINEELYHLVKV